MHSRTHLFAAAMLVHGMHQPLTFNDPTVQRSICRVTVVCAMGIFRHAHANDLLILYTRDLRGSWCEGAS